MYTNEKLLQIFAYAMLCCVNSPFTKTFVLYEILHKYLSINQYLGYMLCIYSYYVRVFCEINRNGCPNTFDRVKSDKII